MEHLKFWLKLIGTAVLLHIALILLSILEVIVYSLLIAPGKDQAFYEAHANLTGPWISAICGALFFFLLVRRYLKRFSGRQLTYAIGLLAVYHIIDLAILFAAGYVFAAFIGPFVFATVPKIAAVVLAYLLFRGKSGGDTVTRR